MSYRDKDVTLVTCLVQRSRIPYVADVPTAKTAAGFYHLHLYPVSLFFRPVAFWSCINTIKRHIASKRVPCGAAVTIRQVLLLFRPR